mmetsp:Transcript_29410/g.39985  ORF Transcript_29410/g.39985 Transcript_29410/m.39985 type:complete len:96 (+) Transcript_29410:1-288(+)
MSSWLGLAPFSASECGNPRISRGVFLLPAKDKLNLPCEHTNNNPPLTKDVATDLDALRPVHEEADAILSFFVQHRHRHRQQNDAVQPLFPAFLPP